MEKKKDKMTEQLLKDEDDDKSIWDSISRYCGHGYVICYCWGYRICVMTCVDVPCILISAVRKNFNFLWFCLSSNLEYIHYSFGKR